MALICSTFKRHPREHFPEKWTPFSAENATIKNLNWWEADGIEPLARRDRVYSAATAPACPYLHFPIVAFGCRERSRTDLEQLMRLPGSRTSLQNSARLLISVAYSRSIRGLQNFRSVALYPNWRKREVLIPNGKAIHLASNERRTPVRLRFRDLAEG